MTETRKLAAILVADVVGYSRLAGADEDRTLSRLRGLRSDLIDPAIAAHHGRIVKRTGDGIIVEFRSVVDAVRCAVEVQTGMVERNAGVQPERRIEFRVGIHLGDVVEEADGDLMGDGVNIAARLEGVAKPGAICLSEDACRQVSGRLDMEVTDLGPTKLKNIEKPIRAYSLEVGKPPTAKPAKAVAPSWRSTAALLVAGVAALIAIASGAWHFWSVNRAPLAEAAQLSIIVLPFANLSGDASQDYLADVLSDQLTTYISRIPGSFVIARSTALTYKGKPTDVKQIGKDLGVRYALEGSVQPAGNRVRVNAQLINTDSGAHLWAEEFDHERGDLLQMQDDIVTRLARSLQIQFTDIEAARLERAHPANPDAQELAMRCQASYFDFGQYGEQAEAGFHLCEQALEIDPNNVLARTTLTTALVSRVFAAQSSDRDADIKRADELASRALAIDSNSADAHVSKGGVLILQRQFEAARAELERAIALNPSQMEAYRRFCTVDLYTGQPESAVSCVDKAVNLSPHDPQRFVLFLIKGAAYLMLRQDDQATEWFRRSLAVNPNYPLVQAYLAAALALSGHDTEAHEALARYLSLPGTRSKTVTAFKKQAASDDPVYLAQRERVYQGLRNAGLPEE
jgi:adenylate cyclase